MPRITTATTTRPTTTSLVAHVEAAIARAERGESKLDRHAFRARGFTSTKVRHLLNNLGSLEGLDYLEVGVHRGATFLATNYRNALQSAVAVDNWSEFGEDGAAKAEFLEHCGTLLRPGAWTVFEQDCFTVTPAQLPAPVNFYLYDGEHSVESQRLALMHFQPMLDDAFIFVVDDYTWASARLGTQQAIVELGLKVRYARELIDGWWNGLYVSVLEK
jgi:methyltransferase family protein